MALRTAFMVRASAGERTQVCVLGFGFVAMINGLLLQPLLLGNVRFQLGKPRSSRSWQCGQIGSVISSHITAEFIQRQLNEEGMKTYIIGEVGEGGARGRVCIGAPIEEIDAMNEIAAKLPERTAEPMPPLEPGDHLDQKTFHQRYKAMPEDVRA